MAKRQTNQERIQNAINIHRDKYDYSETDFSKVKEKTIIICPIHGAFPMDYDHHVNAKNGCPKCAHRAIITPQEYEERANKVHDSKYRYFQDYTTMHDKITFECPIHGIKEKQAQAHLRGQGCEECAAQEKKSIIEKEIQLLFESNNIKFEREKKFNWLGKLMLDFYLPKYNIAVECQGIQHFQPRDFSGHNPQQAKENFKKQQERDTKKYNLCEQNGITVLYYSNIKPKEKYISEVFNNKNKLINKIKNNK